MGSTCGECDATSTATSRAITSRSSHAATSSRTVWVAPPITVDCGEATTETTTSVTPRATQFGANISDPNTLEVDGLFRRPPFSDWQTSSLRKQLPSLQQRFRLEKALVSGLR